MKLALQFVYNGTTEERTWVVRKPNAGVESVLVFCVPLGENSLECQCNGSRDRFRKGVIGTCSCKRGAARSKVSRNI